MTQEYPAVVAPLPARPSTPPPTPPPASGAHPTRVTEYLPGKLDGTLHRVENGRRTGVMWGPSVEGNWYASLARIADGNTFKFVEQSHAEAFLRAEINPNPAAYTQPMHYSYRIGKYQHFMWFVNPAAAHRSAGDEHRFTNWSELREHASGYHDHLNVVVWWRWYGSDNPDDINEFSVTVALPGREKMCEWVAPVTRSQEPEIRRWLDERLASLMALWYPVPFEALA